jgi:hypothetical protein
MFIQGLLMKNDLAAIIIKLGDGWSEKDLKEFASMLNDICFDYRVAGLKCSLEMVKAPVKPVIEQIKKPSLIVVDAQGVVKEKPMPTDNRLPTCPKCGEILMESDNTCPMCA